MADTSYTVGKGKPPKDSQFKKGQSGNPGGRPRWESFRDRLKAGIEAALERKTQDVHLGAKRNVFEDLVNRMVVDAVHNNDQQRKVFLALMKDLEEQPARPRLQTVPGSGPTSDHFPSVRENNREFEGVLPLLKEKLAENQCSPNPDSGETEKLSANEVPPPPPPRPPRPTIRIGGRIVQQGD